MQLVLLQYAFALSTLLVHPRNKKPLENQSIIKGLRYPEQKQPNERLCKDMEVGSSFGKIDKYLYISMLQKFNCKNRCHSLS
ncbi:hypothetical protein EEL48_12175 [Muribaculaceae bacterium Isolate-102 (HZI)]|nr:hypothetical protein EEL48_12175 [Muribaculaceae bacterium Isolate-102 (HZI)]